MAANLLTLLTQAWALQETAKGAKGRPVARQGRKVGRPISSGLGGMNPTNGGDMRVRPLSMTNVPTAIPRNIQSMIAWDSVKVTLTLSLGTGLTETNFVGSLSVHPQASAWASLYDQWSIPQMTVEFDSQFPPGSTSICPMLYTALDFDSSNNIGSITNIEDFSTCEVVPLTSGRRTMRSIRPCTKYSQFTGTGTTTSGTAANVWVDSGSQNVQFYGIRSIITPSSTSGTQISCVQTVWFCFRNQI